MRYLNLSISLLLLLFSNLALAEVPEGIDTYGVYLKTEQGYTPLDNVPSRPHLHYDFTGKMFSFPVAEPSGERPELIVHHPDFHPSFVLVEARSMGAAAARSRIEVKIKPLGEEHFKLTPVQPINEKSILLVDLDCCFEGIYGIALSDPRAGILSLFGEGADHNPNGAVQVLDNVLDAVPDDDAVAELREYWMQQASAKKATAHYEFILKHWGNYEKAEKIESRIKYLKNVKALSEQYIEKYPHGRELDEVEELLEEVQAKLKV